jgi:hypothetical protein
MDIVVAFYLLYWFYQNTHKANKKTMETLSDETDVSRQAISGFYKRIDKRKAEKALNWTSLIQSF